VTEDAHGVLISDFSRLRRKWLDPVTGRNMKAFPDPVFQKRAKHIDRVNLTAIRS